MASWLKVLGCIGRAVVAKAPKALLGMIPFGELLWDVAEDALGRMREMPDEEVRGALPKAPRNRPSRPARPPRPSPPFSVSSHWEWCEDTENGGPNRVIRGGGCYDGGGDCRAATRDGAEPSWCGGHVGIRLARVPSGS
jgi:hypothetical protein